MNERLISPDELLKLILLISLVVVIIVTVSFLLFSRFLKKEQKRGEQFRAIHGPPSDD